MIHLEQRISEIWAEVVVARNEVLGVLILAIFLEMLVEVRVRDLNSISEISLGTSHEVVEKHPENNQSTKITKRKVLIWSK